MEKALPLPTRQVRPLPMAVTLHEQDLPEGLMTEPVIAVDTETMGLIPHRDRLCLVQLSAGDGSEHLVRIHKGQKEAPRLKAVLENPNQLKLFHFARFDIAVLRYHLGIVTRPVYCTKIASKLVRTYTDRHGLKDMVRELLKQDISKQQQSSDWGSDQLTDAQKDYAASDVRYLHELHKILNERLIREERMNIAQACFDFLHTRAELDLIGWPESDIFSHA